MACARIGGWQVKGVWALDVTTSSENYVDYIP